LSSGCLASWEGKEKQTISTSFLGQKETKGYLEADLGAWMFDVNMKTRRGFDLWNQESSHKRNKAIESCVEDLVRKRFDTKEPYWSPKRNWWFDG
jgi:hypothetical protein